MELERNVLTSLRGSVIGENVICARNVRDGNVAWMEIKIFVRPLFSSSVVAKVHPAQQLEQGNGKGDKLSKNLCYREGKSILHFLHKTSIEEISRSSAALTKETSLITLESPFRKGMRSATLGREGAASNY